MNLIGVGLYTFQEASKLTNASPRELRRRFGGWTMGQVNLSKLNHSILLKYSEKPELDPYSVSGKVSLALLEDLMATAAICGRV